MRDAATFQRDFGAMLAGRTPTPDPAVARALAIHRNTATKAALDALADNYPVVRALVGDDAFTAAAAIYVDLAPPAEPRLCFYGADFARFLGGHAPFEGALYLPDVAAVEWLVIEALFAADAPARSASAFADGFDLTTPLALHPATRFGSFATPAGSIWRAHQPDGDVQALETLAWAAEHVVVTRPGGTVAVTVVPPGATAFLRGCAERLPLGDAAARAGEHLPVIFSALITAGAFA